MDCCSRQAGEWKSESRDLIQLASEPGTEYILAAGVRAGLENRTLYLGVMPCFAFINESINHQPSERRFRQARIYEEQTL